MDNFKKTAIVTSLGVVSAGVVWFVWRRHRKVSGKLGGKFPRADDLDRERAKRFPKLKVDRSKVHVVCSDEEWEQVLPQLTSDISVFRTLGFDCEWSNLEDSRRPVSLLQLATPRHTCVLIRLNKFDAVPSTLRSLLSDKGILKVGVACYEDAMKLHSDHGLCVRGCVDLRYIALRSKSFSGGITGLKGMAEKVLGVTLNKSFHLRCSDWEAEELTEAQISYAAADALVGIQIFNKLLNSKAKDSKLDHPVSESDIWRTALSACQGIVDVNFSSKGMNKSSEKSVNPSTTKAGERLTRAYSSRSKPLYHNCQLIAPDDELLSTCDIKKALWYVEKGLGEKVRHDPLTVKLKFEPSGRPASEKNYYLKAKDNICVVCGKKDSYIRKNVVPREYRRFFPSIMKDHKSHDVVLLCLACHQKCSVQDDALKLHLANKCNAPLASGSSAKFTDDKDMCKIKFAAKALMTSREKLPAERKSELEQKLKEFYGVEELDDELLEETTKMDTKVANSGFVPHGKKVVLHVMKNEGLIAFEKMWRQHFLDNMEPKFLPDLWSVDHSHDRLATMENNLKRATKLISREKQFFCDTETTDDVDIPQPSTSKP